MKRRVIDAVAHHRLSIMFVCLFAATALLAGCLATWDFSSTDKTIKIVSADGCSEPYGVSIGYQVDRGDTITFLNRAGEDVTLVFPSGTVTAQDGNPTTTDEIEVTVKKGRRKEITITDDPPLTMTPDNDQVIKFRVKDPCHGGADMIVDPG